MRKATCWKVGGDGDLSASVQAAERCVVGQAKGALLGLLGLLGLEEEIRPGYVSWRGGRPHHQEALGNFIYVLSSPDSFWKYLLV